MKSDSRLFREGHQGRVDIVWCLVELQRHALRMNDTCKSTQQKESSSGMWYRVICSHNKPH